MVSRPVLLPCLECYRTCVHGLSNHSYQHIITGAKSSTPNDILGGILADDMGLGKSLAMLCAVMGSLGRASEYAEQIHSVGLPREGRRAAKSTLIIVPSACESSP
jgi:SWI/SNF-related matrix-associated actin-dependent regulator of chromatin subfamily A3